MVPVTPMTEMSPSAGLPKKAALIRARALRVSSTRITWAPEASTGSWAMMAAAPAAAAFAANLWPSTAEPRRHTKAHPAFALRESYTISDISTSLKPSVIPRGASNWANFIASTSFPGKTPGLCVKKHGFIILFYQVIVNKNASLRCFVEC